MSVSDILLSDALRGPDQKGWEDAVLSETRSMLIYDTFDLVSRPKGERVIKCRTVLRNKLNSRGLLERRKARIVVKGYAQ